eukprot:GABV01003069.1.p2 GENE.GABV01003069.1~~GABV01003069.1.p2  ORF type:complete len:126 (-),score=31.45 GABV01003069.1:9-386(-)
MTENPSQTSKSLFKSGNRHRLRDVSLSQRAKQSQQQQQQKQKQKRRKGTAAAGAVGGPAAIEADDSDLDAPFKKMKKKGSEVVVGVEWWWWWERKHEQKKKKKYDGNWIPNVEKQKKALKKTHQS